MCDFISWIEKTTADGSVEILFLTANDIFNTKRGLELQKHSGAKRDYVGHGSIEFYYEISSGKHCECTDFSTPKNFPAVIAEAIKEGKFAGLGVARGLLNAKAWAEYGKVCGPAWAEYEKVCGPAWAEYEKVRDTALAEYEKANKQAQTEYEKVCGQALAEYEKMRGPALAEYEKVQEQTFWKLFEDKENRIEAWR